MTRAFAASVLTVLLSSTMYFTPASAAGAPAEGSQISGDKLPGPAASGPRRVELVFALDTTGSMGGLIEGAKQKIWAIADEIRKANPNAEVRIGLVAYRDRGDLYVTERTDLSADIHAVYGKLLQFQAAGGGDRPESVNEALNVAVTRMDWTRGSDICRIVFLVGDAPPHMDYPQDVPYTDTLKIAEREAILVNAVQAGRDLDTAAIWRSIAQLGHGTYIPIPQSGGVVVIESPFDQEIIILQQRLGETVIPYGSLRQQSEVSGKLRNVAAAPAPAASDIASFATRATKSADRKVVTGEGDLANDVQAGRVDLDKVKPEDLPADLQKLEAPARAALVKEKIARREALQAELAVVVAKRDGFISEKRKAAGPKDGFDEAVSRMVKEQVK